MANDDVQLRLPRTEATRFLEILKHALGDAGQGITAAPARHVDWTYEDFLADMVGRQKVAPSTARDRVRYVRFLENHDELPVKLRPPEEATWVAHYAGRRKAGATIIGMECYRRAAVSLLSFLGILRWESLAWQRPAAHAKRFIPDECVPRYWTALPVGPLHRPIFEAFCHLGFHTGIRPPGGLTSLTLDDVEWDSGTIHARSLKKDAQKYALVGLPRYVIAHLRDYVDRDRARSDHPHIYVTTEGTPWSSARVTTLLSRAGKQIWPHFKPYSMRHWFINRHLIEHNFDLYATARIADTSTEELQRSYIDHARACAERVVGRWVSVPPSGEGVVVDS